jgi:hypothetical protein
MELDQTPKWIKIIQTREQTADAFVDKCDGELGEHVIKWQN